MALTGSALKEAGERVLATGEAGFTLAATIVSLRYRNSRWVHGGLLIEIN